MELSKINLTLTPPTAQKGGAAKPKEEDVPSESVSLGNNAEAKIEKPNFANAEKPAPVVLTDHPEHTLGGFGKGVALLLTGLAGVTALTGCTKGGGGVAGPGTGTTVGTNSEALTAFQNSMNQIEESMKKDPSQSRESVTGKIFRAMGDYGRQTGQRGEELMNSLAGTIRSHPVLAATVAFTAGAAVGISLDRLGVTDSIGSTAADVYQWVKDHPVKAAAIGLAVAGAGVLIYNYAIKPMAEVPPKPTGAEAEKMEATFSQLEMELQNHQGDPQEKAEQVSRTLTQKIQDYAKATGRSANEVKNDVIAWSYDHPVVATSLVMGAGVATGVVLSRAGVPEGIAHLAGVAVDGAKSGFGAVGDFAKEHPVAAGAVAAGVAAGAGYLIYTAVSG